MNNNRKSITVFEHETIRFDRGEERISEDQFKALCRYHGEKGTPFFSLCYNGIKFNEHVGVIQVGRTLIEVLPKADKLSKTKESEEKWRDILVGMLKAVGTFDIKVSSSSNLRIHTNSILDLFFELFTLQVEYILRRGLVKQYRSQTSNCNSLKGSLQFSKQINVNLTHKERFYTKHATYDVHHKFNQILFKTLNTIQQLNTSERLKSRLGALLLYFPEMEDLAVSEGTFKKLNYNRKTEVYQKAMEISRLILLQYHPDLSLGKNHVLALMLDMNMLWERFVLVSLRKNSNHHIEGQKSKYFWRHEHGSTTSIRPDIVINHCNGERIVLDTKWKNLNGSKPSLNDLRQMYVYHDYFAAKKVALVYPANNNNPEKGIFVTTQNQILSEKECGIINFSPCRNIHDWQIQIGDEINKWISP